MFAVVMVHFRLVINLGVRGYAPCQPYVSADHAVVADDRFAAEDRCAGINHNTVFERGVPFAFGVGFAHAEGSEGDALIKFYMFADPGGLSDHNTRTVVDAKMIADTGGRMDVDTGFTVCLLGKHAWNLR